MSNLDLSPEARLFTDARSHNGWQDKDVPDALLKDLYDLWKFGPTSANCCPMRVIYVTSAAGKERLKPHLSEGNVEKTMTAPVTAILAFDTRFFEEMPRLFPHNPDAANWFAGDADNGSPVAFRNGTLQAGYFIMAARLLGLDCGPMSGFNEGSLNAEYFPDGRLKANMLCNLGYGDPAKLFDRSPRLAFDEACSVE